MNIIWRYTILTTIVTIFTFSSTIIFHTHANTAFTIIISCLIVVGASCLRAWNIRTGISSLPHTIYTATLHVQHRSMIHQLWIHLNAPSHQHWIKIYYTPTVHSLPHHVIFYQHHLYLTQSSTTTSTTSTITPTNSISKNCTDHTTPYITPPPLETYGKVYNQHPQAASGKPLTLHPHPLLTYVTKKQQIQIGFPFLLGAVFIGAWWLFLERSISDSCIAFIQAAPITFWWQAFTGNNPSTHMNQHHL